jgi:ribosomal protein L44E
MHTKTHKQDSEESPKVVDIPLVCGNCGNRDWRKFRYHGEGYDVHGKRLKLFGRCTKCGQSHLFERGRWVSLSRVL